MNIAIDMRPSQEGMGGVAEYTSQIAKHCILQAPEHNFILFFSGTSVTLPSWIGEYKNVQTYIHRVPNKLTNASIHYTHTPTLDHLIKKHCNQSVDVWLLPNLNFISLSPSQKSVMTVHDVSFYRYPEFYSRKQQWWHRAVQPSVLFHKAKHLLAVSSHTKDDLSLYFNIPSSRITVTPLGIQPSYHNRTNNSQELARLGRSILASTAHDPRKNVLLLVEGYCRMRDMFPETSDVTLQLVGRTGRWTHTVLRMVPVKYRSSISISHNISYATLAHLTRSASVFVYPSFYEGFGLPLVEAMAVGTPVITCPNSSMVETAGDCAYYTDPYNPQAMSRALATLLSHANLREILIHKGKQRIQGYRWDNTAQKTLHVLEQVAALPHTI